MAEVIIDASNFGRRLKAVYDNWEANRTSLWDNTNALAVAVGGSSEDLRYLKSISLHLWLFGYELPDTIMVFTKDQLHILSSQKKVSLLEPLKSVATENGKTLVLHVKPKAEDGTKECKALLDAVRSSTDSPILGTLKDKHEGKFYPVWASAVEGSGIATADVASGVADLLSCKDQAEIMNVKKASFLAAKVMKDFVVVKIEDIVDKEKKIKHSKLTEMTEEAITEPSKIGIKLKAENVDIAYQPIFQSGGKYNLKLSAQSDDSPLHDHVIVVSLGTRYSSYCSNIARTYIVDPSKQQEEEYKALLAAQEAAIKALVPGATMASVVEAAQKVLRDLGQAHLVDALGKNIGFGMGLEFRESANVLSGKNEGVVRAGMVFNVCLGVAGLETPDVADARRKTYALQIADTVVVGAAGKPAEVVTSQCPKAWDTVSYQLNDGEEEEGAGDVEMYDQVAGPGKRNTRHDDPNFKNPEQLRREQQEELLKRKNQETLARLTAQTSGGAAGPASTSGRVVSDTVAYRTLAELPVLRQLQIEVDHKHEAVLLPIYGVMVPFHITTIKTVTSNQDNDHAYVRVSFNFSGSYDPAARFPSAIFLKELSFRSPDVKHANKVVQDIKVLRSAVMQRDKERAERATLVQQEKLQRGKRIFRLPDLWVRPGFGGKGRKQPGTLEAHANGFRYSTPKGEQLDVMFRNIRHAFFQPADNDMITLLHFHLIHPIMVGNKKTSDVQFYAEVMDVVQTLDGGRRSMYDPDEIEEEQAEREKRNKVNNEFQAFVKRVQEQWEREFSDINLEFDIPFRELAFDGVPHRSTVKMLPTVNCLVELTEMPFVVVPLEDIEIVNLERVGFNLKNFDMAIVFKDFNRDVMRIDAIPSGKLETVKDWLTSCKIKYYESKLNLAWKPILKSIVEDPEHFIAEGGWDFLNVDKTDSEDDEGEHSSEGFVPSDEESGEEESSDYSSGEESLVDSDEEDEDYSGEGEEEDEGLSWEELEAEAAKADRDREDSDSEDERKARKRKGGGAPAPAAKKRR